MKAHQLIYTGCGKEGRGDFSVWSKSESITKQESNEIVRLMGYPTKVIDASDNNGSKDPNLLPSKYGFFKLSSGRMAVAKSSYIGKVYSILDERMGNFIIHAYVFSEIENFNPYFIFLLDIFKTSLTEKEWKNPAPSKLPMVSIDYSPRDIVVNESKIKEAFRKNRNIIKSHLEAMLNYSKNNDAIIFNADNEQIPILYVVLGLLLPISILTNITFCTLYNDSSEYHLTSINAVIVKMKTMMNTLDSQKNHYRTQINGGKMVFCYDENIFTNLSIGRYVEIIEQDLISQPISFVIEKVNQINTIMKKCSCDLETALNVFDVLNHDFRRFSELNEYSKIIDLMKANGYRINQEMENRFVQIIKNTKIVDLRDYVSTMKVLYKRAEGIKDQEAIYKEFLTKFPSLVGPETNYEKYAIKLDNNLLTNQLDFQKIFIKIPENLNWLISFNLNYAYYGLVNISELLKNNQFRKDEAERIIIKVARDANNLNQKDLLFKIIMLFSDIKNFDLKFLYEDCIKPLTYKKLNTEKEFDNFYNLFNIFENDEIKFELFRNMVDQNLNSKLMVYTYMQRCELNKDLFEKLETKLEATNKYQDFFYMKQTYLFSQLDKINISNLIEFFSKNVVNGKGINEYITKVNGFLNKNSDKKRLDLILKLYQLMYNKRVEFENIKDLALLLEDYLYKINDRRLLNLDDENIKYLESINTLLKNNQQITNPKFDIINLLRLINDKSKFLVYLSQENLFQKQAFSHKKYFLKNHSDILFNNFLLVYDSNSEKRKNQILKSFFVNLLDEYSGLASIFFSSLLKLKPKVFIPVMAYLFEYASTENDGFANTLASVLNNEVSKMKNSNRKALFDNIMPFINDKNKVQEKLELINKKIKEQQHNRKN